MHRLLSVAFVLIWSSGFLVGAIGTRDVAPLSLTTWRFVAAGVLLITCALWARAPWPLGARAWLDTVLTGVLLQGLQFGAGYMGMAMGVPAGLAALVVCLSPVFVAVAAGTVLGERMGAAGWLGTALALAGAAVAGEHHIRAGGSAVGLGFVGLAAVTLAAGTLYQKRCGTTVDLRTGAAVQAMAAAAVVAPLAVVVEHGPALPTSAVGFGALAWLAVVNSIAGVMVLFVLLRWSSGTAVSGLLYAVPSATALLAVPVLGQPVSPSTAAGLLLTVAGIAIVQRSVGAAQRAERRAATPASATPLHSTLADRAAARRLAAGR